MHISCTILIPTKDRPKLLKRAVKSALKALPDEGEVLVIDDKSQHPATQALVDIDDLRLRVAVNEGTNGAAGARNFGMQIAEGDIVFFLDDDDEILPQYCNTILKTVLPAHPEVQYGFSAYKKDGRNAKEVQKGRVGNNKLPEGTIAQNAPFHRKTCGFGVGYWIRRDTFYKFGPIDETLITNEDTEYSCRLIGAGIPAWFSASPGVWLSRQNADSEELDHLTSRTNTAVRAACFLAIYNRHGQLMKSDKQARRHIGRRYIKLATKSGQFAEVWQHCNSLPGFFERFSERRYTIVNFVTYRLAGKHKKTDEQHD